MFLHALAMNATGKETLAELALDILSMARASGCLELSVFVTRQLAVSRSRTLPVVSGSRDRRAAWSGQAPCWALAFARGAQSAEFFFAPDNRALATLVEALGGRFGPDTGYALIQRTANETACKAA